MRENTQELVSKEVVNEVAENFGIKLTSYLEDLDDYNLLRVYNYCAHKYGWGEDDMVFTSVDNLAEFWGDCPVDFAKGIVHGDGEECFKPDNWLYIGHHGYIRTIPRSQRREHILGKLCELKINKNQLNDALNRSEDIDYCHKL